jgi:hypothetical protein
VEVLDRDHDRSRRRHVRQDAGARRRGLLCRDRRAVAGLALDPQQAFEPRPEPRPLPFVGGNPLRERRRTLARVVGIRSRDDPGLRSNEVDEGAKRRILAVGHAAPGQPADGVTGPGAELGEETRLPEARLADDRDQLGGARASHAVHDLAEHGELIRSPNELDGRCTRRDLRSPQHAPHAEGRRLPLHRDRVELLEDESVADRAPRPFADHQPVARRHRLQPARRVDDVARDRLADLRPRSEGDHGLSGRHGDPDRDRLVVSPELLEPGEQVQTGEDGPLRIVVVRRRSTEDAHRGVADELVERAAEPLDRRLRARVERDERATDVFRIRRVRPFGEPDEVREQDRHVPALLGGLGRREGRPARHTEARLRRVDRPAFRARRRHVVGV